MATVVPFIIDPTTAEAVAAWKAVAFCSDLGFQLVIFEGDALEIVNALRQDSPCWSRYGQMIEDTKVHLHSFPSRSVKHTKREANEAAHLMAKTSITRLLDEIWVGEGLSFIQSIVLAEQEVST